MNLQVVRGISLASKARFRLLVLSVGMLVSLLVVTSAAALTVSELMYHPVFSPADPPDTGEALEYIELYNEGPETDDIGGYAFVQGVSYVFPQGTLIAPRSFLLVASNPDALRDFYAAHGVDLSNVPIYGPYEGFLDNAGERIDFRVEGGGRLFSFSYNDGGQWPAGADGPGHSLELLYPFYDLGEPESWEISAKIGGTPGAAGRFTVPTFDPVSNLPSIEWTKESFDDSKWTSAVTPVGYDADGIFPITTTLTDMRYNYTTVYFRLPFQVTNAEGVEALSLEVFYEDGCVAYLNGKAVARSWTVGGSLDTPLSYRATCGLCSPEPSSYESFDITQFADRLVSGGNVLAIHGVNTNAPSSDFIISARLIGTWAGTPTVLLEEGADCVYFKGTEEPVPSQGNGDGDTRHHKPGSKNHEPVVINEFLAKTTTPDAGDWIELYNRSDDPVEIGGRYLSDDADDLARFLIPDGLLQPGEHRVFTREELGFGLSSFGEKIFLTAADFSRVIDATNYGEHVQPEVSYGRYPDGADNWYFMPSPSPGTTNLVELEDSIVINEIMYHPITEDDTDEYVELYNRGTETIDLTGWSLTKAVDCIFPQGTELAPGEYLVIAKDPAHIQAKYGISNIFGPYVGVLANDGENVRLRDQYNNVVDSVRYYDGGTWPDAADGEGSSLELIDPRDDNNVPAAWAASDESQKSSWTPFSHTSVFTNWWVQPESEFHIFLQHRGEALVDSLSVSQGSTQLLSNGSFESGTSGWLIEGTHVESFVTDADSVDGSHSLHIVSSGRGDTYCNRIERDVPLSIGQTYTMSGYARWLSGSKWLLVRTHGQGMAVAVELQVPEKLGSPGAENGAFRANRGPSITEVQHTPLLPTGSQVVSVSARIADIDGIASVQLFYGVEGSGSFTSSPMNQTGTSGIYSGQIPAQSSGTLMAFYIQASDGQGATNSFPADINYRQCVYQVVGSPKESNFPVYRILIPADTGQKLASWPKMSNHLLPCAFIYDETEMYYNCWIRLRGSPFIRGSVNPVYNKHPLRVRFSPDNPLHGRREINLDTMEPGRNPALQSERIAYWISRKIGVPWSQIRFVRVLCNQTDHELYGDAQKVDEDYVAFWFPDDDDGYLYKVDDWFEFNDGGGFANRDADLRYWGGGNLGGWGEEKELYRGNYKIRSRDSEDNLQPIVTLMSKIDPATAPNNTIYAAAAESVMDVEEVLKQMAVRHVVGDWDSWGYNRGKNNLLYQRSSDGRFVLIPWDIDFVLGSGDGPSTSLTASGLYGFSRLFSAFGSLYENILWEIAEGPLLPGAADGYMDRTYDLFNLEGVGAQSPSGIKSYLSSRRNFIRQLLNRPVSITTNGGQPLATTNPNLVLTGTAPYNAKTMTLNGLPVEPTWPSPTSWSLSGILQPGVNDFTIEIFDASGTSLGADQITITLNPFLIHTLYYYNEGVFIAWNSTAGLTYTVLAGDSPDTLTVIAKDLKAVDTTHYYIDLEGPLHRRRFYRVQIGAPVVEPGLKGEYFEGMNFNNLVLSRIDETVDFVWGLSSPAPEVPLDYFSVRWTGVVVIETPGLYTFWTNSDDGVRLKVADDTIIDKWSDHSATWDWGSISLSEGVHSLILEFYENGGDAVIQLEYQGPGVPRQTIPPEALGHTP